MTQEEMIKKWLKKHAEQEYYDKDCFESGYFDNICLDGWFNLSDLVSQARKEALEEVKLWAEKNASYLEDETDIRFIYLDNLKLLS